MVDSFSGTRCQTWFLAALAVLASNATAAAEETQEEKQCQIYMAKSSLKGHTGFGVYTTRDIALGQAILSGPPGTPDGPTVGVVDSTRNIPKALNAANHQWHNVWGHYWWGRGVPDHVAFESDEFDAIDYQITFGSLPNHQCVLQSLDYVFPESPYDDSILNRYKDPGAGAVSYHRGRVFQATRDIKAGSELFLSYGYCTAISPIAEGSDSLHYPSWARNLPMTEHYEDAARSVRHFWLDLMNEYGGVDKLPNTLEFDPAPDMEPQVAQLMPRNIDQLKQIMYQSTIMSGRTLGPPHKALAEVLLTEPRTVEWIRENGMCIEHLIPGKSTIPQAGQGGFSQHFIPKGDLVVPAPLLHISDRNVLTTFDDEGQATGTQVLLNYCFGHKETSMLVCPDTNAILVNHCSDRTKECGPDGPNAMFRWAAWDPDTPAWLNRTVDDIAKEEGRGLSLEIIALRDIQPGDEVFMDYGKEWEDAFAAHVAAWKPPEGDDYKSVKELNEDPHGLDFFVSHDLRSEIDHPKLFTACAFYPTEVDDEERWQEEEGSVDFDELSDEEMLEKFGDDGSIYVQEYLSHADGTYWPCALLYEEYENEEEAEAKKPATAYTVRIIHRDYTDYGEMSWMINALPRFLYNYPRESIHIFPKPYQTDQYLPGAFRHHIPLRDDMVPDVWKNMKDGVRQSLKRMIPAIPPSPAELAARARKAEEEGNEGEEEEDYQEHEEEEEEEA